MLFKTSRDGVKTAFQYASRLPFTKLLLHRLNELARGRFVAFFSLHRVLDDESLKDHPHYLAKTALGVSDAHRILSQIQKTLPFISVGEALSLLRGQQKLEHSAAVLIVEAPYIDTIKNIMPLALKLNIPLSFTLCAHSLATGEASWVDEIMTRIISTPKEELVVNFIDRTFKLSSFTERVWAAHHIIDNLSQSNKRLLLSRLNHVRDLLQETALPPKTERIMSIPDLVKLSLNPKVSFVIGGQHQVPLLDLDDEEAHKEIDLSKGELFYLLREAIAPVFIYPFSQANTDHLKLHSLMLKAGFEAMITRSLGIARPGDNMFSLASLPLGLENHEFTQFEMQGLADAIDEFLLITLAKDEEF